MTLAERREREGGTVSGSSTRRPFPSHLDISLPDPILALRLQSILARELGSHGDERNSQRWRDIRRLFDADTVIREIGGVRRAVVYYKLRPFDSYTADDAAIARRLIEESIADSRMFGEAYRKSLAELLWAIIGSLSETRAHAESIAVLAERGCAPVSSREISDAVFASPELLKLQERLSALEARLAEGGLEGRLGSIEAWIEHMMRLLEEPDDDGISQSPQVAALIAQQKVLEERVAELERHLAKLVEYGPKRRGPPRTEGAADAVESSSDMKDVDDFFAKKNAKSGGRKVDPKTIDLVKNIIRAKSANPTLSTNQLASDFDITREQAVSILYKYVYRIRPGLRRYKGSRATEVQSDVSVPTLQAAGSKGHGNEDPVTQFFRKRREQTGGIGKPISSQTIQSVRRVIELMELGKTRKEISVALGVDGDSVTRLQRSYVSEIRPDLKDNSCRTGGKKNAGSTAGVASPVQSTAHQGAAIHSNSPFAPKVAGNAADFGDGTGRASKRLGKGSRGGNGHGTPARQTVSLAKLHERAVELSERRGITTQQIADTLTKEFPGQGNVSGRFNEAYVRFLSRGSAGAANVEFDKGDLIVERDGSGQIVSIEEA